MAIVTDENVVTAINENLEFSPEFTVLESENSGFVYIGNLHLQKLFIGKKIRLEVVVINE